MGGKMPSICRSRIKQRGAMMILLTLMMMTVIIPMAGLAIDLTIMYIVQAKLWEAVDGAGLAAANLIGTTNESISTLAQQVCAANFPPGYWTSTGLSCTSTYTPGTAANGYRFEVDVAGQVTVPTLFMKVFQVNGALVSSTSAVTRRQSRVVMVVDRSGSMSGLITTLDGIVASFATRFTGNFDELGYVAFGSSAIVGYPYKNTGPYNFSSLDVTGGPDQYFENVNGNNSTSPVCCDMIYAINQTKSAGGATSMSEGLSLAYIELLKARNRDLALNGGLDVRTNDIILFTDGVPNMFAAYLNSPDPAGGAMTNEVNYPVPGVLSPGNSLLGTKAPFAKPSPTPKATAGFASCYYNPSNTSVSSATIGLQANQMIGVLGAGSAPSSFTANLNGLIQMSTLDTTFAGGSGASSWSLNFVKNDTSFTQALNSANKASITDCTTFSANSNLASATPDLQDIPPWDVFGNNLTPLGNPGGYTFSGAASFPDSTTYNSIIYPADAANTPTAFGQQLNIAAWNAVDNAANRIRSDTNLNATIYTIGYSGNGGTDDVLLARVANDPGQGGYPTASPTHSNGYNSAQRAGQYFPASDANAISNAFAKIAGILLNISR
jgi:Flp pilus assembly protein TadG